MLVLFVLFKTVIDRDLRVFILGSAIRLSSTF